MTGPVTLEQVAQQHRQDQARLAVEFVAAFRDLWPLLNTRELDATQLAWLTAVEPLLLSWRAKSAARAGEHVQMMRHLFGVPGQARIITPAPNLQAIRTSLIVTGPVQLKARTGRLVRLAEDAGDGDTRQPLTAGLIEKAADQTLVDVAGAAMRHVSDGGRQTQLDTAASDPAATGWVRVTSGGPCAFCAMLASRGPVYKHDSFNASDPRFTGHGTAKVHDTCGCDLAVTYGKWPVSEQVEQLGDLWESATDGHTGKAAMNAFRRAYEARDAQ